MTMPRCTAGRARIDASQRRRWGNSSTLTPDQTDCLNAVKSSAASLLSILNNILDFSKIESRKFDLESVPFRLDETITRLLKPLALLAEQRHMELIVELAPDLPSALVGDPGRALITPSEASDAVAAGFRCARSESEPPTAPPAEITR